ncbi:MAG: hypothetical protein WCN92_07055 [Eubacteriales bacterium]
MLQTPLGEVMIKKNNELIEFSVARLPLKPLEDMDYIVEGRYAVNIDKSAINAGDTLQIFLNNLFISGDINGGERLKQLNFETDDFMVGIGLFDVQVGGGCPEGYFIEYLNNGFTVKFAGLQHIEEFAIAVAWMPLDEYADTTAVWFAADPFLILNS